MNRKSLSPEDRRAIDLILNHGAAHQDGLSQSTSPATQPRIGAATELLAMLDSLPSIEPPVDLVARTMSRIDADTRAVHATAAIASTSTALH